MQCDVESIFFSKIRGWYSFLSGHIHGKPYTSSPRPPFQIISNVFRIVLGWKYFITNLHFVYLSTESMFMKNPFHLFFNNHLHVQVSERAFSPMRLPVGGRRGDEIIRYYRFNWLEIKYLNNEFRTVFSCRWKFIKLNNEKTKITKSGTIPSPRALSPYLWEMKYYYGAGGHGVCVRLVRADDRN